MIKNSSNARDHSRVHKHRGKVHAVVGPVAPTVTNMGFRMENDLRSDSHSSAAVWVMGHSKTVIHAFIRALSDSCNSLYIDECSLSRFKLVQLLAFNWNTEETAHYFSFIFTALSSF